ncbi:hypothetical protein EPO34_02710 [Patescibacteria group bacterium]|nr:MAG: hypothetical protein EPO34_02710 [Patescibacteria group bacterium]
MRNFTTTVLALATAVSLVGMGCAVQDPANETALSDVQMVSKEISATKLKVVVERGEARVSIEFERGPLRPESWLGNPDEESSTLDDLLVADRNDLVFLTQFGGDTALDPDVGERIRPPPDDLNMKQRYEDLVLARDAADFLENDEEILAQFKWSLEGLRDIANITLQDETWRGVKLPAADPQPDVSEVEDQANGEILDFSSMMQGFTATSVRYMHRAYIRWKPCCWSFGEHSAALVFVYNSSGTALLKTIDTKNHGTAATHNSMFDAAGCPKTWGDRSNYLPPLQPFKSSDTFLYGNAGGCSTPYDAIEPTTGGHVCNDDSMAEYFNTKYNASSSWATCGDSTRRELHPTCD